MSRSRRTVMAVACRGGPVVVLLLFLALLLPPSASPYAFHHQKARNWVQEHYDDTLYSGAYYNEMCTCLVSLAYRKGAGVPFRHYGYYDISAFWSDPDSWGSSVVLMYRSPSWVACDLFRDHFNDYPPAGNDWIRVTRHRCSAAPDEDDRWAGGHVVFYHNTVDGEAGGACANDYFHTGMIYARHTQSYYANMLGYLPYGTCKVERTSGEVYRPPNLINLRDRCSSIYRQSHFVQVNTLVYDP
mgnify:CR=1 FL=1